MGNEKSIDTKLASADSDTKKMTVEDSNASRPGRLKSLATTMMEWMATIVAVLAFFLFLIWGADFILPEGTSLINLDGRDNTEQDARYSDGDIVLSSEASVLAPGERVAAILSEAHETVKHKSAKSISWINALKGMDLFDQDAVKTASASHAVIKFDETNVLQLGPDSLVIIRQLVDDPWLRERRSALVIMEGELRGTMLASLSKKTANVEVIIPGGVARISRNKDSAEKIDYKIKVNPDQSTSVVVFQGVAEVEAQNQKVALRANQVTVVIKGAAPTKPVILPDEARIVSPVDDSVAYYRDFPQEIRFSWGKTKQGRYRIMIARDDVFKDVVLDETVTANEFIHGDLHHGRYFWRVASVTVDGTEGQFSKIHRLTIIQDMLPPLLNVNYPQNAVASELYILDGSVEPGATLIINGKQVSSDDQGRFEVEVKLKKGINIVVAQAVDAAGNATFVSERVSRDF